METKLVLTRLNNAETSDIVKESFMSFSGQVHKCCEEEESEA